MRDFSDDFEMSEFSDFEGFDETNDFDGLSDLELDGIDDFEGLDGDMFVDLIDDEIGSDVEDEAYAAVLEGAYEALYEAEQADAFIGGAVLRRVAKMIARRLARWAKKAIGPKLKRYGSQAVKMALSLLKQVAKKAVTDTISYAKRTRTYRPLKLLRYARSRFWQLMKEALARRGIRVSLESEFA